ncbi:hypothetical protein [Xanthomonas albilineans]|nr:hypothetical protein [Xanthomonas albilineans]
MTHANDKARGDTTINTAALSNQQDYCEQSIRIIDRDTATPRNFTIYIPIFFYKKSSEIQNRTYHYAQWKSA